MTPQPVSQPVYGPIPENSRFNAGKPVYDSLWPVIPSDLVKVPVGEDPLWTSVLGLLQKLYAPSAFTWEEYMADVESALYDLTPPVVSGMDYRVVQKISRALEKGAAKYAPGNWLLGKLQFHEIGQSIGRHFMGMLMGEQEDAETGLDHLDHALCNAWFMASYLYLGYYGTIDRDYLERFINRGGAGGE